MAKILDLFCGAGGFSYGFKQHGFSVIAGIDSNKSSLLTFEDNHNSCKAIYADLSTDSAENILIKNTINHVDVIIGGPPCQGLSLSGPRVHDDPRNTLFLAYVNFIKLTEPKIVLLENVPGLISLFKGRIKDEIIKEFSKLGYKVTYKVLNAADYGVPQTRKRVIFVGYKNTSQEFIFPEPTHFNDSNLGLWRNYVTCEEAIGDLPSLNGEEGADIQHYSSIPTSIYQEVMRERSSYVYNHIAAKHAQHIVDTIKLIPEGGNYKNLPSDFQSTRKFNVAWTRFHSKKPAPTIDTGHRHHFHYKYNRVPTVRECARLQSFPDDFLFKGSKTEQFRQVGNAVPPLLSKAIAKKVAECL